MAGAVAVAGGISVGLKVTREIVDWWSSLTTCRGNNSYTDGVIRNTDKVLFVKEVRESKTFMDFNVVDINIRFDKTKTPEKFSIITGIYYQDFWGDSTGAKGTVVDGGINRDYLVFNVKGQTYMGNARGCHSKLIIFGR